MTDVPRHRLVATQDPYLLRLLLRCWKCDLRLVCNTATVDGELRRTYKCGLGCHREHLLADALESQAWTAAERRATISTIAPPFRKSALEILMAWAIAGPGTDVAFVWKT